MQKHIDDDNTSPALQALTLYSQCLL